LILLETLKIVPLPSQSQLLHICLGLKKLIEIKL